MPSGTAPAAINRATAVADSSGLYAKAGQAAVVGTPARSMLSLTAKGSPHSGLASGSKGPRAASARRAASGARAMKVPA